MRLVVLLPVRNGERLLPDWLASVESFADGVVALDDGSTDGTREVLHRHDLVRRVLTNPTRGSYAGWDDHGNRQRLLDAAVAAGARWVVFLDADERVADPVLLRRLVEQEAVPGSAYGFRIHAASDDLATIDPSGRWVYRLFRPERGDLLPAKRLHLVPIPTRIPRRAWLRTGIRLLHVASTALDDLEHRFTKYQEADPGRDWQDTYDHLLVPPQTMIPVPAVAEQAPLVLPVHDRPHDPGRPVMSAVVISRGDEPTLLDAVGSVVRQEVPGGHEVIVVTSDSQTAAGRVRCAFPGVTVVALDEPALPGRARNAGVEVARGDYVAFPSSHIVLPAGSLAARVRAHERGWAMVTGTVLNGTDTRAGWASYFLDHSTLLPGRPSGELEDAPTRCSYVRFLLERVDGFPEDRRAGEDTIVNTELWRQGFSAYRERDATAVHLSPCTTPRHLWRHHRARGAAWAQILLERYGSRRALVTRRPGMLLLYVPRRVGRVRRRVRRHGGSLVRHHRRSRPLIVFGALAAWWGLVIGIVRGIPTVGSPIEQAVSVAARR